MAERTQSFAVRIGEAVAQRLRDHVAENVEQWFVPPTDVEYGLKFSWQERSKPFVGVSVGALEDDVAGSSSEMGRGNYVVNVWGWTRDGTEPERASHELASDIRRALTEVYDGRQLGGVLASGALWFAGYEVVLDPETGEALVVCSFRAMCQMTEAEA